MHKQTLGTLRMCVLCPLKYYVAGVPLLGRCLLFVESPSLERFGHSSSSSTWGPETVSVGVWREGGGGMREDRSVRMTSIYFDGALSQNLSVLPHTDGQVLMLS